MHIKYPKQLLVLSIALLMCISTISVIKLTVFNDNGINNPLSNEKNLDNKNLKKANAEKINEQIDENSYILITTPFKEDDNDETHIIEAPTIVDDGSIVYDGMTVTELSNKLNKSLKGELSNTGYYFAEYTKRTGLNPYLAVAIVLLETGCNWKCSTFTVQCNNIGGLKGHGSCKGTSYSKYDSLDEGIKAYLDIIYHGYFLKGKDTPEKMASSYAQSSEWPNKVNTYINSIRSK